MTFDDGLKCHYNVAKFLSEQKLNAIFFIPSLDFKNRKILNVHKVHIILATQKLELVLDKLKKLMDAQKEDRGLLGELRKSKYIDFLNQ